MADRKNRSSTTSTGFPSQDKPWLQHYQLDAYQLATNIPDEITVWDYIEQRLIDHGDDIPALEYFGKKVSRSTFIDNVYLWAQILKNIGIHEDQVIAVYGPWFPEIAYLTFATNLLGITPYFLKLDISKEALEEETSECEYAVVYSGMWDNVKAVMSEDRFKKIIFVSPEDSMGMTAKLMSFLAGSKKAAIPANPQKYISVNTAIKQYGQGPMVQKASFKKDRIAFITSSSGTSINGIVKGTAATNKSAIAQIIQADIAQVNYNQGKRALTDLPPTAATSLVCLFFYPLFFNMTVIIEPRFSNDHAYECMKKNHPQVAVRVGGFWEAVVRTAEARQKAGKKTDLSFLEMPIIGGEGSTVEDLLWMNSNLKECGATTQLFSGYGLSEMFSVISVEKKGVPIDSDKPVIDVGIPYPGITVGVFDKSGNELSYNHRGELWIKGPTMMQGYYLKPELTRSTIVDGWLHTGDMFEIDEMGRLYCYGRMKDCIPSGESEIFLFDISNEIRKDKDVKYAMANAMAYDNSKVELAVHLVLRNNAQPSYEILNRINTMLKDYLPNDIVVVGYKCHQITFRPSPTTAKIDRKSYMKETEGYLLPSDNILKEVSIKHK